MVKKRVVRGMAGKRPAKRKAGSGKGKLIERALGPAADEFGRELAPLGQETGVVSLKVGRMLLAPIRGLVTGLETVGEWLHEAITDRLKDVPEDQIVAPDPRIAVPAVQALTYSMGNKEIREMYANLLAADMNVGQKQSAHPAFVEIIREMTPLDSRVLQYVQNEPTFEYLVMDPQMSKWGEIAELVQARVGSDIANCAIALNNLQRIGLIEVMGVAGFSSEAQYPDGLPLFVMLAKSGSRWSKTAYSSHIRSKDDPSPKREWNFTSVEREKVSEERYGFYLTPLGFRFVEVCLPR
jgi:Abortive infection alpha